MKVRELQASDLSRVWSIDRAELIERLYSLEAGKLVLRPERHDMRGWPAGEPEHYTPILKDCLEQGGSLFGLIDGELLLGAAVLEGRTIGSPRHSLQLAFLHVSHSERKRGLGGLLFDAAVARARSLGARGLYISATPSENTVNFYLRRGCRVATDPDPRLLALEPEDIHLELEI